MEQVHSGIYELGQDFMNDVNYSLNWHLAISVLSVNWVTLCPLDWRVLLQSALSVCLSSHNIDKQQYFIYLIFSIIGMIIDSRAWTLLIMGTPSFFTLPVERWTLWHILIVAIVWMTFHSIPLHWLTWCRIPKFALKDRELIKTGWCHMATKMFSHHHLQMAFSNVQATSRCIINDNLINWHAPLGLYEWILTQC